MLAALCALVTTSSCANVDAGKDFRETARDIRERTGSTEAWEPEAESAVIAASIDRMLADDALCVDEAVRVALLSNPGLQAAFMEVGVRKADLVEAGRPRNPLVAISTRFPEGGGLVNLTTSISQSLIDLLLLPAKKRAAAARLAAARGSVVRSALVLAGRVESQSLDLIALAKARAVADESLLLAERSRDLARSRFAAGLSDIVAVHLTEAAVLDARREALVVERDRAVGHAALEQLLGLEGRERSWHVTGDLSIPPDSADTEALVASATERRVDVSVARLLLDAARGDLDVENSRVVKSLALGFQRERAETSPSLNGPTLEGELPLYGGNEPASARKAFRLLAAQRNLTRVRQAAAREVRAAAARTGASRALLALFENEILPAAKTSVDASRRAWQAGEREILVLLEAQRFLVDQRRNYAEALREAARARADLDVAMGGPIGPGGDADEDGGSR